MLFGICENQTSAVEYDMSTCTYVRCTKEKYKVDEFDSKAACLFDLCVKAILLGA